MIIYYISLSGYPYYFYGIFSTVLLFSYIHPTLFLGSMRLPLISPYIPDLFLSKIVQDAIIRSRPNPKLDKSNSMKLSILLSSFVKSSNLTDYII